MRFLTTFQTLDFLDTLASLLRAFARGTGRQHRRSNIGADCRSAVVPLKGNFRLGGTLMFASSWQRVNEMGPREGQHRIDRNSLVLSVGMVAVGLLLSGLSISQVAVRAQPTLAQATPAPDASPSVPAGKVEGPADSKPGGTRPTTPAPEPARPDADAQKAGARPALPPAPAEKMGEPIKK